MSTFLFNREDQSIWKFLLKYVFLVIYMLVGFSVYYFVGIVGNLLNQLYASNHLPEATLRLINQVLAVIAFPFSSGYLFSMITLHTIPGNILLVTTGIGLLVLVSITTLVVKKGNKILLNIAFKQPPQSAKDNSDQKEIAIHTHRPLVSYLKINLLTLTRDMSSLISLTMAILFPLLTMFQGGNQNMFTTFMFYSPFIIFFADNAFSVTEGTVGGLLTSLPFSHRDMLRGKQILLSVFYVLSYLILMAASRFQHYTTLGLILVLFLSIILPNTYLICKSFFYGKINKQYTLFTVEDTNNFVKNMVVLIPVLAVVAAEFGTYEYLIGHYNFMDTLGLTVALNLGLMGFLELINHLMFH